MLKMYAVPDVPQRDFILISSIESSFVQRGRSTELAAHSFHFFRTVVRWILQHCNPLPGAERVLAPSNS